MYIYEAPPSFFEPKPLEFLTMADDEEITYDGYTVLAEQAKKWIKRIYAKGGIVSHDNANVISDKTSSEFSMVFILKCIKLLLGQPPLNTDDGCSLQTHLKPYYSRAGINFKAPDGKGAGGGVSYLTLRRLKNLRDSKDTMCLVDLHTDAVTNRSMDLLRYSFQAPDTLKFLAHIPPHEKEKVLPKDMPYLGVELECFSKEGSAELTAARALAGVGSDFLIPKSDGSTGQYGLELVTAPATLEVHQERWSRFLNAETSKLMGSGLNGDSMCGIHVHIERKAFTELMLGKMLMFINLPDNRPFIEFIAERKASAWAKFDGNKKLTDGKALTNSSLANSDRHEAVNMRPSYTIELRIFKGSVSLVSVLKCIEFAAASQHFCREINRHRIKSGDFVSWLFRYNNTRTKYSHLLQWLYLKAKLDPKTDSPEKLIDKLFSMGVITKPTTSATVKRLMREDKSKKLSTKKVEADVDSLRETVRLRARRSSLESIIRNTNIPASDRGIALSVMSSEFPDYEGIRTGALSEVVYGAVSTSERTREVQIPTITAVSTSGRLREGQIPTIAAGTITRTSSPSPYRHPETGRFCSREEYGRACSETVNF